MLIKKKEEKPQDKKDEQQDLFDTHVPTMLPHTTVGSIPYMPPVEPEEKKKLAKAKLPVTDGELQFALTTVTSWLTNKNINMPTRGNPTKRDALLIVKKLLEHFVK